MTVPSRPVIETRDLVKRFGDVTAVDRVSLSVDAGELVVLLGLSGSGKSTLLRCLNGLHSVTSGEVEVSSVPVHSASRRELRRLRADVGFVFQQFNLLGRLSCLENVLVGALGRVRGPRYGVVTWSPRLRRQALDHLDRVGLGDQAFQRADTLSGGQQQRVALARTLMQGPSLVLADEPVASLDPENAASVMDLLFRVCREDRLTVLCTLHQIDLALEWADRLVGLRDGVKVLDQPAGGTSRAEAMDVYRRIDPATAPVGVGGGGGAGLAS